MNSDSPFNDPRLGPTGRFPGGKLTADDDGEILMGVGRRDDIVILEFGKATKWLGMPPRQALSLAALLIHHAKIIEPEVTPGPPGGDL